MVLHRNAAAETGERPICTSPLWRQSTHALSGDGCRIAAPASETAPLLGPARAKPQQYPHAAGAQGNDGEWRGYRAAVDTVGGMPLRRPLLHFGPDLRHAVGFVATIQQDAREVAGLSGCLSVRILLRPSLLRTQPHAVPMVPNGGSTPQSTQSSLRT